MGNVYTINYIGPYTNDMECAEYVIANANFSYNEYDAGALSDEKWYKCGVGANTQETTHVAVYYKSENNYAFLYDKPVWRSAIVDGAAYNTVYSTYGSDNVIEVTIGNTVRYKNSVSVNFYNSRAEALAAIRNVYPITYHYENSTVSGPLEAAVGDTVTVSAVPDNNYGITDPASQILVTNNDVAVTYQWNPSTNTITFTMPDPT